MLINLESRIMVINIVSCGVRFNDWLIKGGSRDIINV